MSAESIQFIRGPKYSEQSDFPTIALRSATRPDELVMDLADTVPIEITRPEPAGSGDA